MNIGEAIKVEIKRQRKKQKEVADAVGISYNSLTSICKGDTFPRKETLEKICEHLNIEIYFSIVSKEKHKLH